MSFAQIIVGAWSVWLLSWMIAAFWTAKTSARSSLREQLPDRLVTGVGIVMLFWAFTAPMVFAPVAALGWLLVGFVIAGFGFAWWARLHLGAMWSGSVVRKRLHRIIDTGPYALVRHPIYTGLIASVFATAAANGRLVAFAGACLFALGLWMKARLEERFLIAGLGEGEYGAYRARVPMLIPFTKGWGSSR